MRYGVRHYMLKPARKEDLRDNLLELRNEIESRRRERMNVVAESGEKYSFYLQRGMMIEVLSDPSAIDGIIERSMSLTPFDPSEILTAFSSQVLDVQHFISVMIAAVRKAENLGIETSLTFLSGIGGREMWRENAIDTGTIISEMEPTYASFLTLMLVPGTPLHDDWKSGKFVQCTPAEILQQVRYMVANLTVGPLHFTCDHASNYLPLKGGLPEDREKFLSLLDQALAGKIRLRKTLNRGI